MSTKNKRENGKAEILIAEDSPTQAEQLKYILEKHGHRVLAASNGKEAVALMQQHKPTIIISDIIMPEMDGYELCRQVKANTEFKNVPIILLTVLSNPEDVIKGLECGADNFITKPYDEKYLISRIDYLMANIHLQDIDESQMGITIHFGKHKYFISSNRLQIFNLLLSTYETAIQKNRELEKVKDELRKLNEQLEQKVTERTAALRESEEKYRALFEKSMDAVYISSRDGKFIDANQAMLDLFGYTREELIGMDVRKIYADRDDREKFQQEVEREGFVRDHEIKFCKKDGTEMHCLVAATVRQDNKAGILGYQGIIHNITRHKKVEEQLQFERSQLLSVFESINEPIYVADPQTYEIIYVNKALSDLLQKPLVGNLCYKEFQGKESPCEFCTNDIILVEKGKSYQWEYHNPILGRDFMITDRILKWPDGRDMRFEFAIDITERKRAEKELEKSCQGLRKTMDGTILAMAALVEMRDQYTAGHQRRVAQLARAIASELGTLQNDEVEGLYMASVIHDMGKITVPGEILSKPGQLTDTEFSLIKMHPKVAYDVLQTIEFTYPIAQIVYQHHERMDGSGYPQGLRGEEITMAARVLAVADVVEAMSSHRPYRPALGMGTALEEISKKKGILYDTEVVNACIRLFYEREFKLE